MARRRPSSESAEMNMTPMIDVVFQLIIFFVVTLKMSKELNRDIILEEADHGETITQENMPVQTLVIEVAARPKVFSKARGRVSINNATLTDTALANIIARRYAKFGSFPVLIRADYKARHEDVKRVMDICTARGCWKIGFVAVEDHKDKDSKTHRIGK